MRANWLKVSILWVAALALGCQSAAPPTIERVDLPALPIPADAPLRLAPGERASLALDVAGENLSLQLPANLDPRIYQVVPAGSPASAVALPPESPRFHPEASASERAISLRPLPSGPDGALLIDGAARLWIDVRMPDSAASIAVQVASGDGVAKLPIDIELRGPALPTPRPLAIVAEVAWPSLARRWPEAFDGVNPAALDRGNPRQGEAFAVLDALFATAAEHGVALWIPEIAPSTKWPSGRPPQIAWEQYRDAVRPWVEAAPLWPLPAAPGLGEYPSASRGAYWWLVDDAVRRENWQAKARLFLRRDDTPRDLADEAATLAGAVPHATILSPSNRAADVVTTRLPGGASGVGWLDASDSALPLATATDVRLWGAAAYLRGATVVRVAEADLPLFAPAGATGVAHTPALAWLRRAVDDHALLAAADPEAARRVAAALVRPTRTPARLSPAPAHALFAGTNDRARWNEGIDLVASGQDPAAWLARQERLDAQLAGLSWSVGSEADADTAAADGRFGGPARRSSATDALFLRADVLLRSSTDARPDGIVASWSRLPGSDWTAAGDRAVDAPVAGELVRASADAFVPLDVATVGGPASVTLRDRYSALAATQAFVAPAAALPRRPTVPRLDGLLDDWSADRPLLDGPGVPFAARGAAPEAGPVRLLAGWTPAGLHVAFRLEIDPPRGDGTRLATTEVRYADGRLYGEDAAEVLVQPVVDGEAGAALHVVLRPNGQAIAERLESEAWTPFAARLGYAARHERDGTWRGELTIPWASLGGSGANVPELLRFNFSHTRGRSGLAASWAGPIDFGRDVNIAGALVPMQ